MSTPRSGDFHPAGTGFEHESYAYGRNHWDLDPDLRVMLRRWWPEVDDHEAEFSSWGELCGREAYDVADHVDHGAEPVLMMHDRDGRRVDRLRLSPSHLAMLKRISPMNRPPYEGGSWHHHFALSYLLADAGLYCQTIITNQTVYAIHKYAPQHSEWIERLLSGEAFGATWMTEVQGGSDMGANVLRAEPDPAGEGRFRLHGEKYFCSGAGLTDVAIVTARPDGAPEGPKGIALFLVPRLATDGTLNWHVRRLKRKSATRSVPSGEVEFHSAEAFLIGEASQGIYMTLENLTVSRYGNAIAAMGGARKAHLEVLMRSLSRRSFGATLFEHPLIRRDLVDMRVRIAAGLALSVWAVEAFDKVWHERPPYSDGYQFARFLSHLAKNRTAEHCVELTQMGMELWGGLGFLEEFPMSRLHREALITPIWEGPSNVQTLDLLESMVKKSAHLTFVSEVLPMLERAGSEEAGWARATIEQTLARLAAADARSAQWYGKHALREMADAAQVALLYDLAEHSGDDVYARMAALYATRFLKGDEYPDWSIDDEQILALDRVRESASA